jgi:hypothetical protein
MQPPLKLMKVATPYQSLAVSNALRLVRPSRGDSAAVAPDRLPRLVALQDTDDRVAHDDHLAEDLRGEDECIDGLGDGALVQLRHRMKLIHIGLR